MRRRLTCYWRNSSKPFLFLVVLVFSFSSLYSIFQLSNSINIIQKSQSTNAWAMLQLQKEYYRFLGALKLYQYQGIDYEQLMLRYEILWSRYPVLLRKGDSYTLPPEFELKIDTLFKQTREVEPYFPRLQQDPELAKRVIATFESQGKELGVLVRYNYRLNFGAYKKAESVLLGLQQKLLLSVLGLFLAGGVLVVYAFRQSSKNEHLALHDALTGLPNRKVLFNAMDAAFEQEEALALLMIDMDGFKAINDGYGHVLGDKLLIQIAQRMRGRCGEGELLARLAGDEFALLLYGDRSKSEVERIAASLMQLLKEDFNIGRQVFRVSATIGIAFSFQDAKDTAGLVNKADMAMYSGKKGDNLTPYLFFEHDMLAKELRRKQLAKNLTLALAGEKLVLNYQPIVDGNNGKTLLVEALIRWRDDTYGQIPANEIISIAEEYNLAAQLGTWVIKRACHQFQIWQKQGIELQAVSVNISPSQYRSGLHDTVKQVLATLNMKPSNLILEVTEDTTMSELVDAREIIDSLTQLGVSVALDDFGTGYSSLSHLHNLPVDILKIDKSFLEDVDTNAKTLAFLQNIVSLGEVLELTVICEGIENLSQWHTLQGISNKLLCQGFYFSRPQDAETITALLKSNLPVISKKKGQVIGKISDGLLYELQSSSIRLPP